MPRRRRLDRRQVVEAAIAVVDAEGPQALGINRVARALGIKPPSLYNHVVNGDDLVKAVVIEGNRRLLAALRAVRDGDEGPEERMLTLAEAMRTWARENGGVYAIMAQSPVYNHDPEFAAIMEEILPLFGEPLAELGVEGDLAIHAMRAVRAAIHGFVLLEANGQFGLPQGVDDSFRWLVRATVRGIRAGQGGVS